MFVAKKVEVEFISNPLTTYYIYLLLLNVPFRIYISARNVFIKFTMSQR